MSVSGAPDTNAGMPSRPVSATSSPLPDRPARLIVFRPSLADGGADRVTLTLLEKLDRKRYAPTLVLVRREGAWVDRVPADVPVIDLRARRLLTSIPALARTLRELQPDIFLCTAGGANVVAVAAHRLARSRARLVLSERNAINRPGFERRARFEVPLKRMLYPLADEITAVSDGVAQSLTKVLRLPPQRVRAVYNPVVTPELPGLAAEPLEPAWRAWFEDPAQPTILAVGRLVGQKDYPTMLRALVELRKRRPARLIILGKGPEQDALEAKARELGLALGEHVVFAGFDQNPFRWMARAPLLWQSSVTEGLPGTLIQSMACGTPVVATDCDFGPREVVRDSIDGFLVPVGDVHALADRAQRLLDDPALRQRMATEAFEAAKRYTVAASLQRYMDALDGRAQIPHVPREASGATP